MKMKTLETRNMRRISEVIFVILLIVYPLRHINIGLDLWDTGYGYANFVNMGLDHMDPMWFFATYFSNVVGHLLSCLPFAHTLLGMNFYTGLLVSIIAILSYWFMTRKLQMTSWVAFIGEIVAISLCWCPTASLYNYLTYLFLTISIILIFLGMTERKMQYLFWAGICLALNLFVRFSNLTEVSLILTVWAYVIIEAAEERKKSGVWDLKEVMKREGRYTLWCMGGYFATLLIFFSYIQVRYGMEQYIQSVSKLFKMTDSAADYKVDTMILQLYYTFRDQLHWLIVLAIATVIGTVFFIIIKKLIPIVLSIYKVLWLILTLGIISLFFKKGFFTFNFYNYSSIFQICVCFFTIALFLLGIIVIIPNSSSEGKLMCGLLILCILITSVGGNNGIYTSINYLFLLAPYVIWKGYIFITNKAQIKMRTITVPLYPVKCMTSVLLALLLFQSVWFGLFFSYEEAKGAQNTIAYVTDNEILYGIRMNPERASWMKEIGDYIQENHLDGQEVILYGGIPSLSFYLNLPAAFNPWCDLNSYSYDAMVSDIQELENSIKIGNDKYPLVIIDNIYLAKEENCNDPKWELLLVFMKQNQYKESFHNGKFTMWRVE